MSATSARADAPVAAPGGSSSETMAAAASAAWTTGSSSSLSWPPSSSFLRSIRSFSSSLVDLYYESKARLLNRLLNKLALPPSSSSSSSAPASSASSSAMGAVSVMERAGIILSRIVAILQYGMILHPYQIFVLRRFRVDDGIRNGDDDDGDGSSSDAIVKSMMSTLPPHFDPAPRPRASSPPTFP